MSAMMTPEELRRFDGRQGRPAYVAVDNVIYDVSDSLYWKEGDHEGVHQAGQDLTEALAKAPHVRAVVERFAAVGQLKTPVPAAEKSPKGLWGVVTAAAVLALILWALLR